MHYVIARIAALPGRLEDLSTVLQTLATATRQEDGCIQYDVYESADPPLLFTVEKWKDKAAADAHMTTPHIATAFELAGPLLAAPPEILTVVPRL